MSFQSDHYISSLGKYYEKHANKEDAMFMKKYMKNKFEFFGLRKSNREAAEKEFVDKYGLPGYKNLGQLIPELWQQEEREMQHFGIVISKKYLKDIEPSFLELIEFMITEKSWWDTVDYVAGNHAGAYFKKFSESIEPVTEKWMDSGNIWLQRSALLFQLKYKEDTDFGLIKDYSLRLASSKEFFIRKAIGWALRQYTKTNHEPVVEFVRSAPISNFSKTEAMKWLERRKTKQV